jgi:hypothetical protein
MHIFGSGSCATSGLTEGNGNPMPDGAGQAGKGGPIADGEKGVKAACTVAGAGQYSVSGAVSQNALSFSVNGQIASTGAGSGSITVQAPLANGSLSSPVGMPCTLTAVETGAGFQVKAGAVWARFDCQAVTQPPSDSCRADGEFVFENCND